MKHSFYIVFIRVIFCALATAEIVQCKFELFDKKYYELINFKRGVISYNLKSSIGNATAPNTLILSKIEGNKEYSLKVFETFYVYESKNDFHQINDSIFFLSLKTINGNIDTFFISFNYNNELRLQKK